ncbi:MAG: HXXEE domain-containing protein [Planctomycetota bacterium]
MVAPSRRFHWLIPLQWILHFADEAWFGFPAWATRHFAPLPATLWTPGMWIFCVVMTAAGFAASRPNWPAPFPFATATIQSIFAWNAVFHLVSTLVLVEYSPGCGTGLFVFLPATLVFQRELRGDPRLAGRGRVGAAGLGFVLHALVIASLFVSKAALG